MSRPGDQQVWSTANGGGVGGWVPGGTPPLRNIADREMRSQMVQRADLHFCGRDGGRKPF